MVVTFESAFRVAGPGTLWPPKQKLLRDSLIVWSPLSMGKVKKGEVL